MTTPTQDGAVAVIPLQPGRACCNDTLALRFSMEEAETLAGMFKAISHPVRLQIVDLLSRFGGQVCVCDIEAQFELSQPTISHHLKILRQAGLIQSENRGIWIYYHIRPETVVQLQALLGEFRSETA